MIEEKKVSSARLLFEESNEAVTCQNNNSICVGDNYTQDLHDVSRSTKDNTIKTNNVQGKKSIHTKFSPSFIASLEGRCAFKEEVKGNNNAMKYRLSETEKSTMPNEISSNATATM